MDMSTLTETDAARFPQDVLQATGPVLVDFYAPWCGPCQMLAPALERLAEEYAGRVQFYQVNVDESPELAAAFRITGVPTLLIFQNGRPVDTLVGLASPRALRTRLDNVARQIQTAPVTSGVP
jgi:thioredoxin 1